MRVLVSHPQCPNCYAGYKRHVQEKRTSQIWSLLLHHCYPQDDLNSLKKLFLGKCLKRLFELLSSGSVGIQTIPILYIIWGHALKFSLSPGYFS